MTEQTPPRGALGEFPDGKISEDDEGALEMMIGHDDKFVRMDFRTPVEWLALKPDDAFEMARILTMHAVAVKRGE